MANASKFHTDRIKDLMAAGSGNQGNDSQQNLDRLREEEIDVAYRASYVPIIHLKNELPRLAR